jgi:ABC-2 type transport system permease protein
MLGSLIRFEWRYYVRQPSFYVTALIFFLLPFLATVSRFIQIGGGGEIWKNGTFAISQTILIMGLFAMFLVVNFVGNTATRNSSSQMEELLYSKPLSVWQYQLGRFIGVWLVVCAVFAFVPLGILLGSFMPWVDAQRFGPNLWQTYVQTYLIFAVPTLLVLSALFFGIAHRFRSMMALYLVAVGVFILYTLGLNLLDNPKYRSIAALLDPFGLTSFGELARYWTISEKNSGRIVLEGNLLLNRAIWLGAALVLLLVGGNVFGKLGLAKRVSQPAKAKHQIVPNYSTATLKTASSRTSFSTQLWLRTRFEMKQVIFSAPFIILTVFTLFNLLSGIIDPPNIFGSPVLPITQQMVELVANNAGLLFVIILVYYSAEVIWRERGSGMGDIVDSLPVPNMVFWLSKFVAVSLLIALLYTAGSLATMLYQAINGKVAIEPMQYLIRLGYFYLVPAILAVMLAFVLQVLSPNKYVGMLLYMLFFALQIGLGAWGFEHNMYQYGSFPSAAYSDLNGYGWTITTQSWFLLYWGCFAAILFVLGYGLYQRGPSQPLKARLGLLSYQIGRSGKVVVVMALVGFVGAGSYIHYNTRVLNTYSTADSRLDDQEAYERAFKAYENAPILIATDVNAQVQLFPKERRIEAVLTQKVHNKFAVPIEKMLVSLPRNSRDIQIDIAGGTLSAKDERFNTAWLTFAQPIAPGAVLDMVIKVTRQQQGFPNSGQDVAVVENGTFINNWDLFPSFGYNAGYEIQERHEREKRGLPPPKRANKLEDSRFYNENFFGAAADFINFEATISTDLDQIALTPGYLQKEWQENGRRYFHYKMDQPMVNFYAFISGRMAVKKQQHQGVDLEIYYHPAHAWNVDRMLESLRDSLDLFTRAFGPYQHKQMRVIEFPGYRSFAQSFANTVPYSESIGFTADLSDPEHIDSVYYVTAHELAHQWWGHQVGAANVQGSAVISESLSQYAALRVMEQKYGQTRMREFLRRELDYYLRGRSGEALEEMPFYRAENQQYIHYNKGSLVMMAIKNRVGAERLDANLRDFLNAYKFKAPYPTTLDLIRYIKQGMSAADQAFVDDLFQQITLFDLRLTKVDEKKLPDGQRELTLHIFADKLKADGKGQQTSIDFSDSIEIGVFDKDPDDFAADTKVLYLQSHALVKGDNTIVITVPANSAYVGVDPLIKLIDRNSSDNVRPL